MNDIGEHISKINIDTINIKIKDIQDVMKITEKMRNTFGCSNEYSKYYDELLEILWQHLETGFVELDDQLLCSTCFYAILLLSSKKEYYLNKVMDRLNTELDLKEKGVEIGNNMFNAISLTYGIFQSSILQQNTECPILTAILEKILKLLTVMAYEYSQYTFITFKIMTLFKKAVGTSFETVIFNEAHNFILLNVINQNWENPITGVRSLNKIIFQNLISVVDENMYELIEKKLKDFYWSKAKYLMLVEVIDHFSGNITLLLDKYDIVQGLAYSLKKTGLVSAGADMYVAVLKKLSTEEQWYTVFMPTVIELMNSTSLKPIENFINYWCMNTLKKFPALSQTLFNEVNKLDVADHKLFSSLYIIQQSNRLGLLEKYFNSYNQLGNLLSTNVHHSDVHIRMVSFNILCTLHKSLPSQQEYNLILQFLENNVNSDSSILRIGMIKSLQFFLTQLHMTFASNRSKDCDINIFLMFCKRLQHFIIDSLNCDGNYQRKVTTVQIAQSMLSIFKVIPRKKQKGTLQLPTTLLDFIKNMNHWILSEKHVILKFINLLKDPSDDIREHVMNVLMNNYSDQISQSEMMGHLTVEGLSCMRSRFFYQISCGQTIFKLILNILLIEKCTECSFNKVEDIFNFAFKEIKSECNSRFDIVKSIVEGKQLHSYLNIVHNIFEISLEKSHELNISFHKIDSLIDLLENVSNQFSWEQETSVSSDFSKMNDMVEQLIVSSEYEIDHHFNETNISGLHQIVLNCLWLNVKASCELSSILIQYYRNDSYQEVCEKCLKLICNVLETSRHKGAIEAGGTALGKAIQQLTSLPSNLVISKLPMLLLETKLKQFVLETSNMASITRRGAGLSIMIHRIVSSDMKKGKPLFHYFMRTLLETCNNLPEICSNERKLVDNNEKDLPQAIYIHFLTKIVIDSSLASDMMYYSDKLAKLAFDNLASSCWQIRNAALQLYGSLTPKIIGQKKNSGASEEVTATVAFDEFRTHSPKLWNYIEKQLVVDSKSHYDVVQRHNNLVPILSILANLAPYYSFTNEMECKENVLPSLLSLLGSPIYVVRRLASKCILNIYPFHIILNILLNCDCKNENYLHGTLVMLNMFTKQYNIKSRKDICNMLQNKFDVLMSRKCSYLSKEQFERTFPDYIYLTEEMVKETLSEMHAHSTSPGIFLWANFRIKLCLENISYDKIPLIVILLSDCSDFDSYCEVLCQRIAVENFIDKENVLLQLSSCLYSLGFKRKCVIIWRTLYEISLQTHSLNKHLDTSLLYQNLLVNGVVFRMRYMIVLAARIFKDNATEELLFLSNIIFNLCDPETDVDVRLIAVAANNELASKFGSLPDPIKINTIKAAAIFLQDEDEDVRNLSVQFYKNVSKDEMGLHPYICWIKILNTEFLHKVLEDPHHGIQTICNDLLDLLKSLKINNEDEYNPFVNDYKNMYLEVEELKRVIADLKSV